MHKRLHIVTAVMLVLIFASLLQAQSLTGTAEEELAALLTPAVRLERLLMSFDYFGQFTRGDTIFEDYLYEIFRMDQRPYAVGQGTALEVRLGGEGLLKNRAVAAGG